MNCTCIKDVEAKIKEAHPTWAGKKVVDINMEKIFSFSPVDIRTSTNVIIEVEGQKKKHSVGITHTFCPFCGVKQSKEEE